MYLVAGLGISGQSVLRYFENQGEPCYAFDTRSDLDIAPLQAQYPHVTFATGTLPSDWVKKVDSLVLSPGIAKSSEWVKPFLKAGKEVIGDIELFARSVGEPIVAITGSNGKSTVTTLVAEALHKAGYAVGVGGNIGEPALELLTEDKEFDVYVLELSSFQLETTYSLQATSAALLNISEDHMDRYDSLEAYIQAKLTILNNAEWAVIPKGFQSVTGVTLNELHFSLESTTPLMQSHDYGLVQKNGQVWLGWGAHAAVPISQMAQQGVHHQLNALAMMALCRPFQVPDAVFASVLRNFKGLPHRSQIIAEQNQIQWINDSKGTNVGATLAAITTTLSMIDGQLILIAGGVGKEADFSSLAQALTHRCRAIILFGRDNQQIADVFSEGDVQLVETLSEAIQLADQQALPGDAVLFSPACASFDQFKNYIDRGECFERWVTQQLENGNME
ncbi:UDP-N-acetylmuramoyl-L-alanine--D-glutamate ligase [Hydrogenovibrio sp. SC-1]|uniref:UDP-N-acetylmuramoyl-L-alanine--D-glutamate ligase n=1 Tax=Hydrogenovibrio sp. SC-1 TaxID=2065820 RepID=UPI000C79C53E|nr:UDP-N-acetylmuramoyl-L-alanine--D-glutamate ligase [Hydrogenovibrio sp. SC-1]PLA75144.1 UDP-N-acetylmuramoyl-L-alanine--D-glutamate ligase [Hydrogenovibrio sp. SC-1]